MHRIHLISQDNGYGLSLDAQLVRETLAAAGYEVVYTPWRRGYLPLVWRILRLLRLRVQTRLRPRPGAVHGAGHLPFDLNIFFQFPAPIYSRSAPRNCLLANPEWFFPEWRRWVKPADVVLCKSAEAVEAFARRGYDTRFLGFTTRDRLDRRVPRVDLRCVHVAGGSLQKGTAVLAEVWRRHPEWPLLTIVQTDGQAGAGQAANLRLCNDYVSDEELLREQNLAGIHLCPSESEGYGHTLVEALSCGAATLTTDGPPMNELVVPGRGVLTRPRRSEPRNFGSWHTLDAGELERSIEGLLRLHPDRRSELGANARRWFEENDRAFRRRLVETVSELVVGLKGERQNP